MSDLESVGRVALRIGALRVVLLVAILGLMRAALLQASLLGRARLDLRLPGLMRAHLRASLLGGVRLAVRILDGPRFGVMRLVLTTARGRHQL